jgi:hypothetical protein
MRLKTGNGRPEETTTKQNPEWIYVIRNKKVGCFIGSQFLSEAFGLQEMLRH